MYIRRKVFSLLQNYEGEERYFSTTDYELSNDGCTIEKIFAEHGEDSGMAAMNVEKGEAIGLAEDEAESGLEGREAKDALLLDPHRVELDGLSEAEGRVGIPLRSKTLGSDAGRPTDYYYQDHRHNDDPGDEELHDYSDKKDDEDDKKKSNRPDDWDDEDESHVSSLNSRREDLKKKNSYGKYAITAIGGMSGSAFGLKEDGSYNGKHGALGALVGAGLGYGAGHLVKKLADRSIDKDTDRLISEYSRVTDKNGRRLRGLEQRMTNDRKDNPNVVYVNRY